MKVNVIGGGPAGLYFAILYKKAWPQARITVYERNRPDDTFGFGVVFSDQTLETFQNYDLESYRSITENFAYWDDIEIHFKGTVQRIGGNGFCGCSRATLLQPAASARAGARRRAEIPARRHRHRGCIARRRSRHRIGRHQFAHARNLQGPFPAAYRPAAEQVHLDGLDPAVRCLHLLLQARPNTASSSSTPINTSPAARPGSSKPIRTRSRRWASIRWTSPAPRS